MDQGKIENHISKIFEHMAGIESSIGSFVVDLTIMIALTRSEVYTNPQYYKSVLKNA
jgi:hypothetical protein